MLDDLREKTKELQMLHVTRDFQSVFNDGKKDKGHDKGGANEVSTLEALAKQREALHAKLVQDKQRKLRRVTRSIEEKRSQVRHVIFMWLPAETCHHHVIICLDSTIS